MSGRLGKGYVDWHRSGWILVALVLVGACGDKANRRRFDPESVAARLLKSKAEIPVEPADEATEKLVNFGKVSVTDGADDEEPVLAAEFLLRFKKRRWEIQLIKDGKVIQQFVKEGKTGSFQDFVDLEELCDSHAVTEVPDRIKVRLLPD